MGPRHTDIAELLLLAALWGASFLVMRLAVVEFGPLALVFVRVAAAGLLLLPLVAWQGASGDLRRHWPALLLVGALNSALPFVLFGVAALVLNAGLMSIFNATAPLWGALVAWAWLGDRPGATRLLGLAIGFAGVVGLGLHGASFKAGAHGISPAVGIAACVVATVCYGIGANVARQRLAGVPPLAVACGSQLGAAVLVALPAAAAWPAVVPPASAWLAALVLAVACTALAYLLYFRLIANIGAGNAMAVTFLIPAFAIGWGAIFLAERPTAAMVAGCAVVLAGTALATGLLRPRL